MSNELANITETTNSVLNTNAYSTINPATLEDKLKIAGMLNAAVSLSGHEGEEFTIIDCMFKPGTRRDRNTGADVDCTDTYVLTADGEVYFSKSEGVIRSLRNILAVLPDLNKPDGVRVRFEQIQLSNGNPFKQFVPIY